MGRQSKIDSDNHDAITYLEKQKAFPSPRTGRKLRRAIIDGTPSNSWILPVGQLRIGDEITLAQGGSGRVTFIFGDAIYIDKVWPQP